MSNNLALDLLDSILDVINNPDYRDDYARMVEIRRLTADAA